MLGDDDDDERMRRRFTRRAVVAGGFQIAGFAALGLRLFDIQVRGERRYGPLADDNRISLQVLAPKRGRILDRAGRVLVDNDEIFRATLTPALAGDAAAVLTLFRRIVALTPSDAERLLKRMKKQSRHSATVIATDLTFDQVARINLFAPQLPGVRTEISWRRRYRGGAPVGQIVGRVGSVERFSVDDELILRLPDARVGKSGAEAGFETQLRGTGGAQKIEVDARGRIVRNLETTDPVPGRDVTLSIDRVLQQSVLDHLQRFRRASVAVVHVTTGEIVALASTPAYDAADIAEGITEESWRRLISSEDKPLLNRAVGGQYPPGSTFKMVTALAALKAGVVKAGERVTCDGSFEFAGHTYRCWNRGGHGPMALHQAIRSSCDVYFFEMARRVGIVALAKAARDCGLGTTFDFGLPEEKAGLVADPDWKRGKWNAGWLGGETILCGIGQGYMLSTPLQLAVMSARIASGRQVAPTLEARTHGVPPLAFPPLPFSADHLARVRAAMFAVVNESGGTGGNAYLGTGRPLVAGKTGTSQVTRLSSEVGQDDLQWEQRDHALFVGYTPSDAPRYAAAAVVEHGGSGGSTAAPLVRDVLLAVLDREGNRNARAARDGGAENAPAGEPREG